MNKTQDLLDRYSVRMEEQIIDAVKDGGVSLEDANAFIYGLNDCKVRDGSVFIDLVPEDRLVTVSGRISVEFRGTITVPFDIDLDSEEGGRILEEIAERSVYTQDDDGERFDLSDLEIADCYPYGDY